jgi:hypothetical protein
MKEVLIKAIDEIARFVGRGGLNFSFGFNPEHCPHCDGKDPLDDEFIDVERGDH